MIGQFHNVWLPVIASGWFFVLIVHSPESLYTYIYIQMNAAKMEEECNSKPTHMSSAQKDSFNMYLSIKAYMKVGVMLSIYTQNAYNGIIIIWGMKFIKYFVFLTETNLSQQDRYLRPHLFVPYVTS